MAFKHTSSREERAEMQEAIMKANPNSLLGVDFVFKLLEREINKNDLFTTT